MLFIGSTFFIVGLLGLAWSTVAAPVVGLAIAALLGKRRAPINALAETTALSLDVLIAAHNEESVIRQTLESVISAAQRLASSKVNLTITVGCDHCTDNTVAVVEKFAQTSLIPVKAVVNSGPRGKWNVLNFMISQSQADWVALVDAASVWNADLLAKIWPTVSAPGVIGVAPSYSPQKGGSLERYNWRLEQFLKQLENQAGGPISVHGASVLYRRDTLMIALAELKGVDWLNDDVAIPLTLRLQNPESRIVYFSEGIASGWVSDIGVKSELGVEYRRRRRMLIGNLQWVNLILFPKWNTNVVVTAIASRRFFRMLWAYWILFIAAGAALIFATVAPAYLIWPVLTSVGIASFTFSNWARRLAMAFISGLQLPRYWKEFSKDRGVVWL